MGNIERQLLNSAEEGANGSSGSTLGAKFLANLANGTGDPKIVAEGIRQLNGIPPTELTQEVKTEKPDQNKNSYKKDSHKHKGFGNKGNPTEINASIANARKIETHVAHDLAKLRNDKEALLFIIADLKIKEKQVIESGRRGEAEALRRKIAGEQKRVDTINGVLPERNLAEDQKKIQGIVTEWHDGKRDWTKELAQYAKAEKSLKKNPSDGHTQGEANRARTEKVATEELLGKVGHEAEQIVASNEPHPAQDDSIGNIRIEGSELMRAVQPEADPEELIRIEPAGTGSLELPEEQGGGIEQGSRTVEDAQINTTTEALANQIEGEATQATSNDWQEEAISKWEATSGKKVLDLELEHTPEEHNASLPVLIETVDEGDGVPVLTEVVGEAVDAPQEGEVSTLELKKEETPEERKERILNIIYKKAEDVPGRGKKAGMSETMLDIMHAGGETYQALPLKTKLLVSVTLFGIAWTAGGTIASVAIGGSLFQRALGGLATFVGIEGLLKAGAEKGGRERGEWEKRRHTAEALIAGFIVGGGALGQAIQNVFHEVVPTTAKVGVAPIDPSELEQGQANLAATEHFNATNVPVEAVTVGPSEVAQGQANLAALDHVTVDATNVPVDGGAAAEAVNLNQFIKIAEAGDSRWSLVERVLEEGPYKDQFNAIASDEQRTYIVDALKDKLTAGMTAEQANTLNVGDKIDFQEIFVDGDFMDKTFSDAQNLIPEEVTNIHNYSGEVAGALENTLEIEAPARMVSAEDFLNQPLHTDFSPPVDHALPPALPPATHTEIPATTHTMPQEIMPNDPQVLAYADQQVHTHITTLFGSKGFFGFGAADGMKSANWLDFANRPVAEIMNAKPNVFPTDGTVHVGIENNEALNKMKDYLKIAFSETGVQPKPGETVEKYLKRAAGMAIGKFMNKG